MPFKLVLHYIREMPRLKAQQELSQARIAWAFAETSDKDVQAKQQAFLRELAEQAMTEDEREEARKRRRLENQMRAGAFLSALGVNEAK